MIVSDTCVRRLPFRRVALRGALVAMSVLLVASCATSPAPHAGYPPLAELAASEPLTDDAFAELEEEVARLDEAFNVTARDEATVYFAYGAELVRRDRYPEALTAYERGLRLDAFDLDAQIRTAELEVELDRRGRAYQRLRFVVDRGAGEPAGVYARELIAAYALGDDLETIVLPDRSDLVLGILPVGLVDDAFVAAAQSRLSQEFRVTVDVLPRIAMPEAVGSREAPGSPGGAQFDALDLLTLVSEFSGAQQARDGVLGIIAMTDADLYTGDLNYLFALSTPGASVLSTARFYIRGLDTVDEGLRRTVVQAMTSFVQVLGVERASSIPCATAYPHSLEEFDQKTDILCRETLERLVGFYETR